MAGIEAEFTYLAVGDVAAEEGAATAAAYASEQGAVASPAATSVGVTVGTTLFYAVVVGEVVYLLYELQTIGYYMDQNIAHQQDYLSLSEQFYAAQGFDHQTVQQFAQHDLNAYLDSVPSTWEVYSQYFSDMYLNWI